jgi:hypothetical protein
MAETLCGSPLYMAPEILEAKKYDAKADLWSVGTIMYEMAFGRPPYLAATMADLLRTIKNTQPTYPVGVVSPAAIHLMQGLLQPDPDRRMTFDQFFNHVYLNLKAQDRYIERSRMTLAPTPPSPSSMTMKNPFMSPQPSTITEEEEEDEDYRISNSTMSQQYSGMPDKSKRTPEATEKPANVTPQKVYQSIATNTSPQTNTTTGTHSVNTPDNSVRPSQQPKINPFIGGSNMDNKNEMGTSSYVMIPSFVKSNIPSKTLDQVVITSGRVIYPDVIFDFSNLKGTNLRLISELEQIGHRAWIIAEAAFLTERVNKRKETALALYSKALDLLSDVLSNIQNICAREQPTSQRLSAILSWIQTQFDDILERADRLKLKVISEMNMLGPDVPAFVCAEDVLYNYALKLAKEAAYLEYLSNNSDKSKSAPCVNMYKRSKYVFDYLMFNCEYLTNASDHHTLKKYCDQFNTRIQILSRATVV